MLAFTANGEVLGRLGNRSPHAVPHGVFRCRDRGADERWVALAVHDDADWARLIEALGRPSWATDASLATFEGRLARVGEIECKLDGWTRARTQDEAVAAFVAAGLDAGPVEDLGDLHDDPQLAHRHHFRSVEHPVLGTHPAETHAIRFSGMEPALRTAAPRLGQHTEYVLRELLGLSADEYHRLADGGVLE
jgi:benzylsuccinate CoA-transferase BbsF subunit